MAILLVSPRIFSQALPSQEQTVTPEDWVAVNGPHIDYESFVTDGSLLQSKSTLLQLKALDHLESAIRNGKTSPSDTNLVHLLASVCLEPSSIIGVPGQVAIANNPSIRAQGIRLLTTLGGPASRGILSDVILIEPDPAVISEAYYGFRTINAEMTPAMIERMIRNLRDPFGNGPNDGLIQEILRCIQFYQKTVSTLANKDLFDAIMAVYQNHRYLQKTNDMALATLKQLMGLD